MVSSRRGATRNGCYHRAVLSPAISLVVVVIGLACTVIPALLACWLFAHHLGVLLQLRGAARLSRLDRPGSVVLSGRVAAIDGELEPINITIEQERVASARSPVVLWREVARTPALRPFAIVLANGAEVRVEPDADTRVATELGLGQDPDSGPLAENTRAPSGRRLRSATIRVGEEIQLVGALRASTRQRAKSSAFRGAVAPRGADETPPPRSLVVRRHPLEPLLLSKRKLSHERAPRMALHAFAFALFLPLAWLLHFSVLQPYYRLALTGTPMWATVVAAVTPAGEVSQAPRAGDTLRLAVEIDRAQVVLRSEPVDAALATQVADAQRDQRPLSVTVLASKSHLESPVFVLGTRPRAPALALPLAALALLFSVGYFLGGRRARPWFERPRLDEREPLLDGPLLAKNG